MRTYCIALREITLKIWRIAVSFTSCVLIILINKKQTNTFIFVIFLNLSFSYRSILTVLQQEIEGSHEKISYFSLANTVFTRVKNAPRFLTKLFTKKSFHSKKKNINASYNWRFAEVSFVTISNFLSLLITVIQYDHNVYLISCFLNTLLNLFMDWNWKCLIGRLFNSS